MRKIKLAFVLLLLFICGQSAEAFSECSALYPIQEGDKWGFIDCSGKVVVTPRFISMPFFKNGYAAVHLETVASDKTTDGKAVRGIQSAIVDINGKVEIVPDAYLIGEFSEGLVFGRKNRTWGFFDKTGAMVLSLDKLSLNDDSPMSFNFEEGLAGLNAKDGGIYFVDRGGSVTFRGDYLSCSSFTGGLAIVSLKSGWTIIDKTGKQLIEPQGNFMDFSEGLFLLETENDTWKYINTSGKTVFELQYDYAGIFYDGLALVEKNEKWGYIDKTGNVKINFIFDEARNFKEGLAEVRLLNKWGFIGKSGRFIIKPEFDYVVRSFRNGLAYVQQGECEGYINRSGNWIWKKGKCARQTS